VGFLYIVNDNLLSSLVIVISRKFSLFLFTSSNINFGESCSLLNSSMFSYICFITFVNDECIIDIYKNAMIL
jgi:hypothetical protein